MIYGDAYKNTRNAISEYTLQTKEKEEEDFMKNAALSKAHIKELALLHFDVFSDIKLDQTVSIKSVIQGVRKKVPPLNYLLVEG